MPNKYSTPYLHLSANTPIFWIDFSRGALSPPKLKALKGVNQRCKQPVSIHTIFTTYTFTATACCAACSPRQSRHIDLQEKGVNDPLFTRVYNLQVGRNLAYLRAIQGETMTFFLFSVNTADTGLPAKIKHDYE